MVTALEGKHSSSVGMRSGSFGLVGEVGALVPCAVPRTLLIVLTVAVTLDIQNPIAGAVGDVGDMSTLDDSLSLKCRLLTYTHV